MKRQGCLHSRVKIYSNLCFESGSGTHICAFHMLKSGSYNCASHIVKSRFQGGMVVFVYLGVYFPDLQFYLFRVIHQEVLVAQKKKKL